MVPGKTKAVVQNLVGKVDYSNKLVKEVAQLQHVKDNHAQEKLGKNKPFLAMKMCAVQVNTMGLSNIAMYELELLLPVYASKSLL